jgi:hypothetical protein
VVREIRVEGHAVAGAERVAFAVDDERDLPALDQRALAAARLVHGRIAGAAGLCARRERVARELGPQPGRRRGEDLVAMATAPALAALAGAHDRDRPGLVEAQQLREPQVEPPSDAGRDRQGRAGLAALDLGEHRRGDARALREVAQRERQPLAQGADPRTQGAQHPGRRVGGLDRHCTTVRYHVQ